MVVLRKNPRKSARALRSSLPTSRKSKRQTRSRDTRSSSPSSLADSPSSSHHSSPSVPFFTDDPPMENPDPIDPSNPNSPYFLHSSDHPGSLITSIRLDGPNYDDWFAAMTTALDAKNKIGFVDGSLPRLHDLHPHFRAWSRCNSMVKSWLHNSVTLEIQRSILRIDDSATIWRDLRDRFHLANLPRTYNLMQEIQDIRQGTMTLSAYYTKLKTLWDQLASAQALKDPCTCGKARELQQQSDQFKIIKFLAGLNDCYSITRRQILAKKVLPSISEVYNMLDQDDNQKSFSTVLPSTTFQISEPMKDTDNTPSMTCYTQPGYTRPRPFFTFCNRL